MIPDKDNNANDYSISDELLEKFKVLVADRCGLYFQDNDLRAMKHAVIEMMKIGNAVSAEDYYNHLKNSHDRENEFRKLLNSLTVNHTYFFRDELQFKVLKDKILPEMIENKRRAGGDVVTIWSAGCSTGEEPYSLAITAMEVLENCGNMGIVIYATDANTNALDKAREGVYGPNAIKLVSDERLSKYFTCVKGRQKDVKYRINDSVKAMVGFSYQNLLEEEVPRKCDIVFFRNVIIYFEQSTIQKILGRIHEHVLDDTGYLFMGYSESLLFMRDKFKMHVLDDAIFYRTVRGGEATGNAPVLDKYAPLVPGYPETAESGPASVTEKYDKQKFNEVLVEVIKSISAEQYIKAVSLIDTALEINGQSNQFAYLKAQILINQRQYDEAVAVLRAIIVLDQLYAPAYGLLGFIYYEKEDFEQSRTVLRKALYIDEKFVSARFHLAELHKKNGQPENALLEFKNIIRHVSTMLPGELIPYSGGISCATLMSICKSNVERLTM
jgi:chemotaxis protein methyltransferase CheR